MRLITPFRMIPQSLPLAFLFGMILSANPPLAQDEDTTRAVEAEREAARQRQADEELTREIQRSIQAMREFMNDTTGFNRAGEGTARREMVRRQRVRLMEQALQQISIAASEVRRNVGSNAVAQSAKQVDENADIFLDVIKEHNREHPRFDSAEFQSFTALELASETLTMTERILPDLQKLLQSEREASIDINFLLSLPRLELDLRRLKWMARRLK